MRLCRFRDSNRERIGLYADDRVIDLGQLAAALGDDPLSDALGMMQDLIELLPPDGTLCHQVASLVLRISELSPSMQAGLTRPLAQVEMLPPIARPPKLLLLAGNYLEHVKEQGDVAAEREQTFPYVFSKPPSTTMIGSGQTFSIPPASPNKIDYELELAVVIGRRCRDVQAQDALQYVAGYTVINDISDRGFRPNPKRQERPRDKFFDWLHGKWHDGSCPCGPCLTTVDEIPDPHALKMHLAIDGETRQEASSGLQVFSISEVIAFISSFVTLEPGDIISTGTPSGVGNATGRYLRSGNEVHATIEKIGTLITYIR
jgi:2-keto-4-pentenoate hydratase/2-oxohepta-3-ene-1,7-dioic acid hydratase in catechol pathway